MNVQSQITEPRRAAVRILFVCVILLEIVASGCIDALAQAQNLPEAPDPRPPVNITEPQNLLVGPPEGETASDQANRPPALPRPRPAPDREAMDAGDALVVAPDLLVVETRTAEEDEACRSRLRGIGVAFERWPTISRGGQCRVEFPLLVSELSPAIAVEPAAIMSCDLAEAVAIWMRDVVAPAASTHLSTEVTGLEVTSAFHCRSGEADAVVDAHGAGGAIDIVGLTFRDRDPINVRDRRAESAPEGAFQAEILAGACETFNTVLSPGADFGVTETDTSHFHFDIARRRDGERICR